METTEVTQESRETIAKAIAQEQGFWNPGETIEEGYDESRFEFGSYELRVLTDAEADDQAAREIRELLWAFNADFLASYMPEGIDADEINAIRGERCEDANAAMLALVQAGPYTLDDLVEEAISADGRGHFLSSYDGEEIEYQAPDGTYWYGYRQ